MNKATITGSASIVCLLMIFSAGMASAQCSALDPATTPVVFHDEVNITGTTTWAATSVHVLQGMVEVKSGGTLNIDPGTCIFGDTNSKPAALVVRRGGTINSNGTASMPVIMTSANDTRDFDLGATATGGIAQDAGAGNPLPGDWGGVVIVGNAQCNGATDFTGDTDGIAGDCELEGVDTATVPGFDVGEEDVLVGGNGFLTFGGGLSPGLGSGPLNNSESSGSITFTRFEFGGFTLDADNELNVLVLAGVGNGTVIENVQASNGSDDGIEIFGGTVDLKNVVIFGNLDDQFDYSYGWQGRVQFLVVQLPSTGGDEVFEVDGNEKESGDTDNSDYDLLPLTNPQIYNATLVGDGSSVIHYRRGAGGTIENVLVAEGNPMLKIDDAETFDGCTGTSAGDLYLNEWVLADPTGGALPIIEAFETDPDNEGACTGTDFAIGLSGLTGGASDRANPNFVPIANFFNGANPPSDGFFDDTANYPGAISTAGTPFYLVGSWVRFN